VVACDFANFHTAEGFSLMTKFLEKYPDLGGVFCVNDCMALGAIRAIDLADKTGKIWVTSYDNLEEARNEIRNGRLHATVEQYPEQLGASSVKLAVEAMEGRTVPDNTWMELDLVSYETFDKTMGLCVADAENPFFSALNASIKTTCDIFGIKLVVKNAANDAAKQLSDIAGFIEKEKIDLLLLTPTQTESMVPGVEMTNTAKIPVMTIDRKVAEGTVVCHIESDNVAGGRLAAEFIAEKLGGKGTIVELEGMAGTSVSFERSKGFNEALLTYPGLKVVARESGEFRRDKAETAMRRLLEKKVEFNAVFAHCDSMVLGVIDVLKEQALNGKVITVGFDAIPDARRAIAEGCLTATIAQKADQMGKMAARNGAAYFRGDPIKPVTRVEVELVTKTKKR
jgi:ribose transport system substrate-binding protein